MSEIQVEVVGSTSVTPTVSNGDTVNVTITQAGERGFKGDTGAAGATGKSVELQTTSTYVQWRLVGDTAWTNLVPLSSITGPQGRDGSLVEFQQTADYIQWRYVGGSAWTNLVALSAITGPAGPATLVSVGSTTTLAAGSNATVNGTTSGANLTLAFGIPRGVNGTNGVTPSFAIGNVVTGAAGSSASVTATTANSGANITLDLTIPRGDPGTNGTNGTGGSNLTLSDATPANLGTAAAGSSNLAARADHIHTLPSLTTLGAAAFNHAHNYVTALNNLTGGLTLAAGGNVTITAANSTLTIAASGGGITDNDAVDGGFYADYFLQGIAFNLQPQSVTANITSTFGGFANITSANITGDSWSVVASNGTQFAALSYPKYIQPRVGFSYWLANSSFSSDGVNWSAPLTVNYVVSGSPDAPNMAYQTPTWNGTAWISYIRDNLGSSCLSVASSSSASLIGFPTYSGIGYVNGKYISISSDIAVFDSTRVWIGRQGSALSSLSDSATYGSQNSQYFWTSISNGVSLRHPDNSSALTVRSGFGYFNGKYYAGTICTNTQLVLLSSANSSDWTVVAVLGTSQGNTSDWLRSYAQPCQFAASPSAIVVLIPYVPVIGSYDFGGIAYASTDGANWSAVSFPFGSVGRPNSITWTGSQFVATRSGTDSCYTSADGFTWSSTQLPGVQAWRGVAGTSTALVVLTTDGTGSVVGTTTVVLGSATLTVNATETSGQSVSYQWQSSTDAGATYSNVPNETTSTLSLVNITKAQNLTRYRVMATAQGVTPTYSSTALLTVNG